MQRAGRASRRRGPPPGRPLTRPCALPARLDTRARPEAKTWHQRAPSPAKPGSWQGHPLSKLLDRMRVHVHTHTHTHTHARTPRPSGREKGPCGAAPACPPRFPPARSFWRLALPFLIEMTPLQIKGSKAGRAPFLVPLQPTPLPGLPTRCGADPRSRPRRPPGPRGHRSS